jgi:hypothetical protein
MMEISKIFKGKRKMDLLSQDEKNIIDRAGKLNGFEKFILKTVIRIYLLLDRKIDEETKSIALKFLKDLK